MWFRLLTLLLLVYCYHVAAVKRINLDGKSYAVLPHPGDCTKYMLCGDGKCKLETCDLTYVFDPNTSTCTHQKRRTIWNQDCGSITPRKLPRI